MDFGAHTGILRELVNIIAKSAAMILKCTYPPQPHPQKDVSKPHMEFKCG